MHAQAILNTDITVRAEPFRNRRIRGKVQIRHHSCKGHPGAYFWHEWLSYADQSCPDLRQSRRDAGKHLQVFLLFHNSFEEDRRWHGHGLCLKFPFQETGHPVIGRNAQIPMYPTAPLWRSACFHSRSLKVLYKRETTRICSGENALANRETEGFCSFWLRQSQHRPPLSLKRILWFFLSYTFSFHLWINIYFF